jgi:hypothetical protein
MSAEEKQPSLFAAATEAREDSAHNKPFPRLVVATIFPFAFVDQRCIEPGCGRWVAQAEAWPSWRFKMEGWLCREHRDEEREDAPDDRGSS